MIMVQLATRGRKEKFLECLQIHVDTAQNKDRLFFNISCDVDDECMNNKETEAEVFSIYKSCFINYNRNSTKVEAINANVSERDFDILVNSSDDMTPQIAGWDQEIRKGFEMNFPDYDGVLHYNDGFQGERLNTLCIMGRKYYDRFGYIYYPEYKSIFCDNEFTEISKKLGKTVYIDKVLFLHDNVSIGGCKNYGHYDDTYHRGSRNGLHDKNVWNNRRLHQNLGLDEHGWYQ